MAKKKTTVRRADIEALEERERAVLATWLPLRGACDQKEIEHTLEESSSFVHLAVRKLVRDGYLYEETARKEGGDARGTKYIYGLTDEGKEAKKLLKEPPKKKVKRKSKLSQAERAIAAIVADLKE